VPVQSPVRTVAPSRGLILGRCRWHPDGKALAFLGQDPAGRSGIYLQDFDPPRDTTATRRAFAGFDAETAIESFAFSPDGRQLVVSALEIRSQLVAARGIPGLGR
jgi:Tol biopolymer transport system component